jgi:DNA-binding transcriptional LysR family regulator
MVACASPGYLAANGTPAKPRDLIKHNCLIYTYAASRAWTFIDRDGKDEVVRVSGRVSGNGGDALLALAVKDAGIALAPDYLVGEDLAAGRLIRLLPDYTMQDIPVYAVYPHSRFLSAKTRTFIDFLATRFGLPQNKHDGIGTDDLRQPLRAAI